MMMTDPGGRRCGRAVRWAKEQGLALPSPDRLLTLFTRNVLETALNEELTEHLGHENAASQRSGPRSLSMLPEY